MKELEVALGLHELVETLQMQEECELQNLVETLESEIGESRIDYDVIKAIYYMPDAHLSYVARDRMYSHLLSGILVDKGNVWFSLDDDGKTQEIISAIKVLPPDGDSCSIRYVPAPLYRFSKTAIVRFSPDRPMQVKIRTQFLSSDVTYAAYFVCKPNSSLPMQGVDLIYTLNNTSESYVSYSHKIDYNGWWMFELFQTTSSKRTADFEITFRMMNRILELDYDYMFEGI